MTIQFSSLATYLVLCEYSEGMPHWLSAHTHVQTSFGVISSIILLTGLWKVCKTKNASIVYNFILRCTDSLTFKVEMMSDLYLCDPCGYVGL